MKITIDSKEILVTDPNKNIVEIGEENGITIIAPCFRNKKKTGCCNACVIEVDGTQNMPVVQNHMRVWTSLMTGQI